MKKSILFITMIFSFYSCKKTEIENEENLSLEKISAESPSAFSCINAQVDKPPSLAEAQSLILGKWQLKGVIAMIQNPEIPNYQVEFLADGTVYVYLAGKKVFTNAYSVLEETESEYRQVKVVTDDLGLAYSEHNIVKGAIRICETELMVDQGIAYDAPGYLFRKLVE